MTDNTGGFGWFMLAIALTASLIGLFFGANGYKLGRRLGYEQGQKDALNGKQMYEFSKQRVIIERKK